MRMLGESAGRCRERPRMTNKDSVPGMCSELDEACRRSPRAPDRADANPFGDRAIVAARTGDELTQHDLRRKAAGRPTIKPPSAASCR